MMLNTKLQGFLLEQMNARVKLGFTRSETVRAALMEYFLKTQTKEDEMKKTV